MRRGPRILSFPQDGEQSPPAGNPEGAAKNDAASPLPERGATRLNFDQPRREGARRLNIPEPTTKPEGARRLSIPETTQPMSNERGGRRLNIPEQPETPPSRKLNVPEAPAPAPEPARTTRRLTDVATPAPPAEPTRNRTIAPPEPVASAPAAPRRTIAPPPPTGTPLPPPRAPQAPTKTDLLIQKAQQIEPSIRPERIRGRIDTILPMTLSQILDWGNRNLTPLQNTSNAKAEIAGDLSRIDPSGWIQRTLEASCKPPSFLDRFNGKPPSYWEGMMQKTRTELQQFVVKLDKMKGEFFREITDLHLDAVSMLVCVDEFADDSLKMAAQNRGKTLLAAHQTAAMLQMTIEQALMNCANYCQKIDEVLTVTIPQWKMALNKP